MTCDEIDELAGAIALDAIPDEEWPSIRAHLASCTRGHPELRELRAVAALLLEAAPPLDPPAGLRDRILGAARAEAEPGAASREPGAGGESPATAQPRGFLQPVPATVPSTPLPGHTSWWARAAGPIAAAAAVAAIALGIWSVALRRDLDRTQERLAAAESRRETAERAAATLAGGGRSFAFTTAPAGAGGSVLQPDEGEATVVVQGLTHHPSRVYQVWAIRGSRPESLGVFEPDESGRGIVALDTDLAGVDSVAITLEPAPGGSTVPSSTPILVAPLRG